MSNQGIPDPRHPKTTPAPTPKRGAIVEDETLVGQTDGSVRTKEPDGKVAEGATDDRENR